MQTQNLDFKICKNSEIFGIYNLSRKTGLKWQNFKCNYIVKFGRVQWWDHKIKLVHWQEIILRTELAAHTCAFVFSNYFKNT